MAMEKQLLSAASTILLDIEGTTTSIDFVKNSLFPYVLENLENYLQSTFGEELTQADIAALRKLAKEDAIISGENTYLICDSEAGRAAVIDSVMNNVRWQMGLDRKTMALKQLQGHMWRNAYETGAVKGHIYEDVAVCFKQWCDLGKKVCIYSSGSIEAQQLLFRYSEAGDLTQYLSGHFDTNTGAKRECDSYRTIARELGVAPASVLFLTDIVQEAQAAREAGMSTALVLRPGNALMSEVTLQSYDTLVTFHQIKFAG